MHDGKLICTSWLNSQPEYYIIEYNNSKETKLCDGRSQPFSVVPFTDVSDEYKQFVLVRERDNVSIINLSNGKQTQIA